MADKTIGSLPQASVLADDSKFVCEDSGVAKQVTGKQIKDLAKAGAEAVASHQPIIQNGTWWTWDADAGVYVDTGSPAKGQSYLESVKTQMDAVAETNTLYCLGTVESLSIALPDSADIGAEIAVIWYNGGFPCTLTITGNVIPVSYEPTANTRSEINALYDGTKWAVLWHEIEVVL